MLGVLSADDVSEVASEVSSNVTTLSELHGMIIVSLKFVRKIRINKIPALVQIMAWRRLLSYKTCLETKPVLYQDRFCIFYRGYKTGFVPKRVKYKTCIVSNTKIESSIRATNSNSDSHTLPLRQSKYLFKMKRQV